MNSSHYQHIDVKPMEKLVGAEIKGIDLAEPLNPETASEILKATGEFGVTFFRDQELTPEQHLSFARSLGKIDINRFFGIVSGQPEIAEVRKDPEQKFNIGGGWHADHSYDKSPALGSILLARTVPKQGGDTLFANMYAAYESLSNGLKATLGRLHAVHSSRHVFGEKAQMPADLRDRLGNADQATQDTTHPVVITHPSSGRKVLYINPGFTVKFEGWSIEESRPLLKFLYEHASSPEFTYRFHWKEGSIAFWDNRCTWHYAVNDYHGESRLMHRITLSGCTLES
jgi:taurine dioxygenase